MHRKILSMAVQLCVAASILMLSAGCKKETAQDTSFLAFKTLTSFSFPDLNPTPQQLKFTTNEDWQIQVPETASWITINPKSGTAGGNKMDFTVEISVQPGSSATGSLSRAAELFLCTKSQKKSIKVSQCSMPKSSDFNIPDDMLFSTTLGHNTTNVAQGFDYDPDEDVIYITQKYGAYRNHIGWQKREKNGSTTVAPNYMTLACFSHGNNIAIEKMSNGTKFVWAPNYGTRQDDGSYDHPHIVSRLPLENKKTIYNKETTENYYFGLNNTWPAFDFKNDLMAVCDYQHFYIYRLSELKALPEKNITLDFTITYGGKVGNIDAQIDEWTGKPVVKAKDCRSVKPLYTVTFDYSKRGLHWQTYCINNGWVFALLQADPQSAPAIMYDTYVEAYAMDGSKNIYKIRQEYMQNKSRILEFGFTEPNYFYCEPEGIIVDGDIMYLMFTMKSQDSNSIRRPVVFRLASPLVAI